MVSEWLQRGLAPMTSPRPLMHRHGRDLRHEPLREASEVITASAALCTCESIGTTTTAWPVVMASPSDRPARRRWTAAVGSPRFQPRKSERARMRDGRRRHTQRKAADGKILVWKRVA